MIKLRNYLEKTHPIKIILHLTTIFLIIYLIGVLWVFFIGEPIKSLELGQDKKVTEIFLHNLNVSLLILLIGSITGGCYSVIIIFLNGYILGKLLQYLTIHKMLYTVPPGLLPHAIIEIFTLCIFSAISMLPILMLYYFLTSPKQILRNIIYFCLKALICAIFMLLIAALLECHASKIPV